MKNILGVVVFFLIGVLSINAQTGTLSGVVKDGEFNDVLPFANVTIKESDKGTTTDFEGAYDLKLQSGTYVVVFSFLGYENMEVTDVIINENDVTVLDVTLQAQAAQLKEVVITASQAKNTEASVLKIQKSAVQIMDGLSAQSMTKIGASNVAGAVKSVPGVSVQGGKYVYVRGLGDRYTKSILNGVDIPGLDPDRNTIQMDIFPTGIIDNIQVVKSFTPDVSADFTGGIVNIITKDFPVKKIHTISVSGSFNPSMHFKSDYLTAQGSSTDFLGFDNGYRDLPISQNTNIPSPSASNGQELTEITQRFNSNLAVEQANSPMDFSIGLSTGNLFTVGDDNKLGYLAAISYKKKTEFYRDYKTGTALKEEGINGAPSTVYELENDKTVIGDLGKSNVLLSGLAGITYKTKRSKYKLSFLQIQNGESTAGYFIKTTRVGNAQTNYQDAIGYTQRSISNLLINGTHSFDEGSWKVNWKISPTKSQIQDKDVRLTPFEYLEDTDTYAIGSTNPPRRIWRNLNELNLVSKIDIDKKHTLFKENAKLKFGANYTYKQRDFGIDQYTHSLYNSSGGVEFNADADQILADGNIWTPENNSGTIVVGNFEIVNTYDATQKIIAGYISEEFNISEKIKSIIGFRAEKFDVYYTGRTHNDPNIGTVYDNENLINVFDFFPSVNMIYSPVADSNVRLSYTKTTARPSFKEASIAEIFDPISDRYFIGNPNVKPTYIDNIDVRFEKYGKKSQLFAISGFFKYFTSPIELSIFNASNPGSFTPRNVESALVFGGEIEWRQNLAFMGMPHFSVNLNTSLVKSIEKMDKSPNGEYESRLLNRREGEEIKDTRELQGQSPYIINAGISYTDDAKGLQANINYNTQGETLQVVGIGSVPDVYTLPFHNANFNISKTLGEDKKTKIKLQVSNLINDNIESVYKSYKASNQVFSKKQPGQSFSLSFSHKF